MTDLEQSKYQASYKYSFVTKIIVLIESTERRMAYQHLWTLYWRMGQTREMDRQQQTFLS